MKIFHISDLHIGKKLLGESLLEEQRDVLEQILQLIDREEPQLLIIAGDIYDKVIPAAEAVMLLDAFLEQLSVRELPVCIISGNHDSPERLSFGRHIFEKRNIHISTMLKRTGGKLRLDKLTLTDEYGKVNIYLLPFVKPVMVQHLFEEPVTTHEEAVRRILEEQELCTAERNVLAAHQFVTWQQEAPQRSDSEQISLGGLDNVDAGVFREFDYTALGHVHRPQKIGTMYVRYAGSPLPYSFSECNHKKAVTCIEMREKGVTEIKKLNLTPKHRLVSLRDSLAALLSERYEQYHKGYYLSVTVTDDRHIFDPIGQLRARFEGILEFKIEYTIQKSLEQTTVTSADLGKKTPVQIFTEFFESQHQDQLSAAEQDLLQDVMNKIEEG